MLNKVTSCARDSVNVNRRGGLSGVKLHLNTYLDCLISSRCVNLFLPSVPLPDFSYLFYHIYRCLVDRIIILADGFGDAN